MKAFVTAIFVTVLLWARPALAQEEVVWVQIEAQPSLTLAQDAARRYAANLPDVNGFALGGGWYGVLLGPYTRADAERVLQVYRADSQVPRDSYIQVTARLRQQFFPVGADILAQAPVEAPVAAPGNSASSSDTGATLVISEDPAPESDVAEVSTDQPRIVDETPAQARRSEAALSRDEKRALQIALQWAGFYRAAIDGAFGRGTRGSMSAWQQANGYEATGVLTTAQRAELLAQYNAPLTSVGLATARDSGAGIEMLLPLGEVAFSRYEPPFAHYDSSGDQGIRALLISQPGDQTTLFGLYEILQTLEIVPLDGPRERGSDSFTLEGRNSDFSSYTEAALEDGHIKGFTLIWPTGDEARRTRVLEEMRSSFTRLGGVLDPAAGADSVQSIDLISGLEIRKPKKSRSGFFIDPEGTVVTTSEIIDSCSRLTLDGEIEAALVTQDAALGVAVLRPSAPLSPLAVGQFLAAQPRLQSDVAVSGFSYEGVLGAPTLTFGTVSDIKGLQGESELKRLALVAQPGDAGGPVLDAGGSVLGMLLPRSGSGPQLPSDVRFAANAGAIGNVLATAGLSPAQTEASATVTPVELDRVASGMTVLVSCWE